MIVSKDAKEAYQQISGLFILYIFFPCTMGNCDPEKKYAKKRHQNDPKQCKNYRVVVTIIFGS